MITKIEVNGFKSLTDFKLNMRSGLNILVGPNGAGKTNIVLFFEFLSNLMAYPIGNAVSHIGGAGSIFKKIGKDEYDNEINVKIFGANQIGSKLFLVYEYIFQIRISFEKDNIYYSNQEIRIRTASKFWDSPDSNKYNTNWDLQLVYTYPEEAKGDVEIKHFNLKKLKPRFIPYDKLSKEDFTSNLKSFILSQNPLYNSLVRSLFGITDYLHAIFVDLRGGETFNIVPSKVKEQEDSATPPGIKKDGSGLATTLYAMKKGRVKSPDRHMRIFYSFDEPERSYSPKTLDKIISYLRLANTTIKDLDVENDPFNNKLIVKIFIETGSYNAVLPLSSMSDGTIKWLTLITAILTSKTIFSIEEPENFLHPWMQAEIANIMRNHLLEKKSYSFVLMTTHSESLLNYAKPEELIIVDLNEGKTTARRVSNLSAIKDEISTSGFGLGHFYFSNALSDE